MQGAHQEHMGEHQQLTKLKIRASCRGLETRVLEWWRHKNDFSEIMCFMRLFETTYL